MPDRFILVQVVIHLSGDATDNNDTTLSGLLDLGSGTKDISNMPKEYLSVYQDGSNLSLGNDNNIDTATDVNTVTIYGSVSGEILGGYGSDNITVTKNLTGNISVGDNADTLTAGWIYGGSTVSMGTAMILLPSQMVHITRLFHWGREMMYLMQLLV